MNAKQRYKLTIEYVGTGISGWQYQTNALSIQQIIEEAIFKFSKEQVIIYCAGRTDAGVHAIAQVAHLDLEKTFEPRSIMRAINHFVRPHKISIKDCQIVRSDFHARFDAKARHYMYKIINRLANVAIDYERAWWIPQPLDIKNMQEAAQHLIGYHDFTSFRAKYCQARSPLKTLSRIDITYKGEEIYFDLSAPSFLYHMVRNIVGSLVLVGRGKWQPIDIKNVLQSRNRSAAGTTAPAYGLYFTGVEY